MSSTRVLFVHALSPLHAGTGQSVGAIDLAIARDRATGHPYLPGSSLKGALRARAEERSLPGVVRIFGPDTRNASDHAGALLFGDANLLLLPVRSVAGTFAWATSPYLLAKARRDFAEAGLAGIPVVPNLTAKAACQVVEGTALGVPVGKGIKVVFEDLDLEPTKGGEAREWATFVGRMLFDGQQEWQDLLARKLCIVHDDVMTFLSRHATDVVARVALDNERKTVRAGALWYEESLPVETVLLSLAFAAPNASTQMDPQQIFASASALAKDPLQLGGKATVGRGRCRLVVAGGAP